MRGAFGTLLAGLLLLGIATIGAVLLENRCAEFEARGSRVSGVVVEVQHGIRNSLSAVVRYGATGAQREGWVQLNSTYANVKAGDSIVVIYDPAAPENVAVPGIPHEPAWLSILIGLIALAGLSTSIIGGIHLSRAVLAHRKPGGQRRSTN